MKVVKTEKFKAIVILDAVCFNCGHSCKKSDGSLSPFVDASVAGGYCSPLLKDMTIYSFNLCEPCILNEISNSKVDFEELADDLESEESNVGLEDLPIFKNPKTGSLLYREDSTTLISYEYQVMTEEMETHDACTSCGKDTIDDIGNNNSFKGSVEGKDFSWCEHCLVRIFKAMKHRPRANDYGHDNPIFNYPIEMLNEEEIKSLENFKISKGVVKKALEEALAHPDFKGVSTAVRIGIQPYFEALFQSEYFKDLIDFEARVGFNNKQLETLKNIEESIRSGQTKAP